MPSITLLGLNLRVVSTLPALETDMLSVQRVGDKATDVFPRLWLIINFSLQLRSINGWQNLSPYERFQRKSLLALRDERTNYAMTDEVYQR